MNPSPDVIQALHALRDNQDFVKFLAFVANERDAVVDQLCTCIQPVLIHQRQGAASMLADLIRLARGTEAAMARLGQRSQP